MTKNRGRNWIIGKYRPPNRISIYIYMYFGVPINYSTVPIKKRTNCKFIIFLFFIFFRKFTVTVGGSYLLYVHNSFAYFTGSHIFLRLFFFFYLFVKYSQCMSNNRFYPGISEVYKMHNYRTIILSDYHSVDGFKVVTSAPVNRSFLKPRLCYKHNDLL